MIHYFIEPLFCCNYKHVIKIETKLQETPEYFSLVILSIPLVFYSSISNNISSKEALRMNSSNSCEFVECFFFCVARIELHK